MIWNKYLLLIITAVIIGLAINVEGAVLTVADNNAGTHNSIAIDHAGYLRHLLTTYHQCSIKP